MGRVTKAPSDHRPHPSRTHAAGVQPQHPSRARQKEGQLVCEGTWAEGTWAEGTWADRSKGRPCGSKATIAAIGIVGPTLSIFNGVSYTAISCSLVCIASAGTESDSFLLSKAMLNTDGWQHATAVCIRESETVGGTTLENLRVF